MVRKNCNHYNQVFQYIINFFSLHIHLIFVVNDRGRYLDSQPQSLCIVLWYIFLQLFSKKINE